MALESTWLTQYPFFHLSTTIIGMVVVKTWKLADWHQGRTQRWQYRN